MESFPVKQNAVVPALSSQSPPPSPPPFSPTTTTHHQPPPTSLTTLVPCVVPPHECIFSCGHIPTVTTLSLATPHQPPPLAASVPHGATATPHQHELSPTVLALSADIPCHESSSAVAPTLALVTPAQPPSSATTAPSTAAPATPHHERSIVLALSADTYCHEPSSPTIAPTLALSAPWPAQSSASTASALSLVTPRQPPSSVATAPSTVAPATPHHKRSIVLALSADTYCHEPLSPAIAPTLAVSTPHPAPSSASTTYGLSLVTPHQPPSSVATTPSTTATATPHHERSIVLALSADPHCHEPSSSTIAPTLVVSTPHPATSSADTARALRLPLSDYKSSLNTFVQKTNISLPKFQTVNEGLGHAPRFRSTVWVDNTCFTSRTTFSHRKAAEQDVSRVALEGLYARYAEQDASRTRDSRNSLRLENTRNSKSILNEYALKLKIDMPTYTTRNIEGPLHLFVSSVVFNGTNYRGDIARNKKDAEQLAAHAAILSILGDSRSGTLYEILKSKSRVFTAVRQDTSQCVEASTVPDLENTGDASLSLDCSENEVVLPDPSNMSFSSQDFRMPGHAPSVQVTMPPNLYLQPDPEHSTEDGLRSKKQRKNEEERQEPRGKEIILPIPSNMSSPSQDFSMHGHEPSVEVTMSPNLCLQPDVEHSIEDGSRSKKRQKNEEDKLEPRYQFFEFL